MRARIRLAAIVVAFACSTGVAHAGGPGDVYNDFAQDGKLSCNHSRADLLAVLRSGSINQYGDPYRLARLKLAVRRQLAGGCRADSRRSGTVAGAGTRTGPGSGSGTKNNGSAGRGSSRTKSESRPNASSRQSARQSAAPAAASTGGNGDFATGRALLAVLLVVGLALGGWLTRRALAARH
jgi:cobalamin biosynthesis Mg chelatase CobN